MVSQETVLNRGIPGNTSYDLLFRLESDVLSESPDLVLVMVGTNDMLNSSKMLSYEDYSENLSGIVRRLKHEGIEILLLSPPTVDTAYLFERHDRSLFPVNPDQKLDTVARIMEDISRRENIGFLDINGTFRDLSLPRHNSDELIQNEKNSGRRDGVHLTGKGYSFIAEQIFGYLNKTGSLKQGMKIVCFGDSLTYGSNVKGSGTSTGVTYPARLSAMIHEFFDSNKK